MKISYEHASMDDKKELVRLFAITTPECIIDTDDWFVRSNPSLTLSTGNLVRLLSNSLQYFDFLEKVIIDLPPDEYQENGNSYPLILPDNVTSLEIHNSNISSISISTNSKLNEIILTNNPMLIGIGSLEQHPYHTFIALNNACDKYLTVPKAQKATIDFITYVNQESLHPSRSLRIGEMSTLDRCTMSRQTAMHALKTVNRIATLAKTFADNELAQVIAISKMCMNLFTSASFEAETDYRTHSLAYALAGKPAVCEAKAKAMAAILQKSGIDADVVSCHLTHTIYKDHNTKAIYLPKDNINITNRHIGTNHAIVRVNLSRGQYYIDIHNMQGLTKDEAFLLTKSELTQMDFTDHKQFYLHNTEECINDSPPISEAEIKDITSHINLSKSKANIDHIHIAGKFWFNTQVQHSINGNELAMYHAQTNSSPNTIRTAKVPFEINDINTHDDEDSIMFINTRGEQIIDEGVENIQMPSHITNSIHTSEPQNIIHNYPIHDDLGR